MKVFLLTLIACLVSFNVLAAEVRLIATGDIMAHTGNIKAAKTDDGYDFTQFFSQKVVNLLKSGDLVIGNLETRMAGAERGYTGYPAFNAPNDLARDLKMVGFNFLTTANNHVLDRGPSGIVATNGLLTKIGFGQTGSFATREESDKITVKEINGIKIAILAYTYGTNGIELPIGKDYMVNYLKTDKIISDIKMAHAISDFVIVCVHWGEEYEPKENKQQIALAKQMHAAGADLIIGHHPHVTQGSAVLKTKNDFQFERKAVVYSLGNFISGQTRKYTDRGQILVATIQKSESSNRARLETFNLESAVVTRPIKNGKHSYRVELISKNEK